MVVDRFLQIKIQQAHDAGISVNAAVSVPAELSISNAELISIFGNLIDNSIESCKGMSSAEISLSCVKKGDYLVIRTQNPAVPEKGGGEKRAANCRS